MLAIDIETMPNEKMIEFLPEVEPDSRLKDEAKIQADIERKKQKQIETMALNPLYGQIACIGYYSKEEQTVSFGTEKELIKEFLDKIENENGVIVTWNGKGFDFPFIFKRACILELAKLIDLEQYTKRYSERHIDLMELWCGYNKFEKLDTVYRCIFREKLGKEEFDVSEIPELIKTASGKELIRRYCLRDCELTYKIGKKYGL